MSDRKHSFERGMRRSLAQWDGCSPTAIAEGSRAQMFHFVADAKADIALLAALYLALAEALSTDKES